MILQAVMGAAKRAEEEKHIRMAMEAEARANEEPAAPTLSANESSHDGKSNGDAQTANHPDPLKGFDTGLKLTPEVDDKRDANGASAIHPAVMNGNNGHNHADGEELGAQAQFANGSPSSNGAGRSTRRTSTATGYEVNAKPSRRIRRRPSQTARKAATRDVAVNGQSDASLQSAFGKYAFGAAADFSNGFDAHDDFDSEAIEPVAAPANANTAPSNRIGIETARAEPKDPAPAPLAEEARKERNDVVIALSDKRDNRIPAADVEFAVAKNVQETTDDPQATVTLTRETATFSVPADDERVTSALSAAHEHDAVTATQQPQIAPKAAVPPPLPNWAVATAPSQDSVIEPTAIMDVADEATQPKQGEPVPPAIEISEPSDVTVEPDTRWQLTKDPLALDDEEDDQTIVTIAQRLRPVGGDRS